ncbi:MAG TPA: hypothetical protein VL137_06375 [Polyangiaceae bacterium]|nr:hypothetical protein [Polyangiaceae bacterium]
MIQRAFRTYFTASATLAAGLVLSGLVVSAPAHAQDSTEPSAPATDAPATADEPKPAEAAPAEQPAADAAAQADARADADADVGVKLDTKAAVVTEAATTETAAPRPGEPPARYGNANEWKLVPYGQVKVDAVRDSTQSFFDAQQPYLIARPGTYKGEHGRTTMVAKDSRLGLFIGAPQFGAIKSYGKLEVDFFGLAPTDAKENDLLVMGPIRIRQGFIRMDNPIVDVLFGQTHDLYGWGGYFYPATVAFLGVPGEIYHRNPQLRLERKFALGDLEILLAAAAVRPGQRDSGIPDAEGGLKLAFNGWKGASMSGFSRPSVVPISIGVSGLYRWFEMPAFRTDPGTQSVKQNGQGIALSAMLPVIPAKSIDDKGNALTLTGEFSTGKGDADMYSGLDGGSRLPLLPNPSLAAPQPVYPGGIDPGLVTFDRAWSLQPINWQAFVAGLQYYLPIAGGSAWISGVYSQAKSNNIKSLTPQASYGAIFTKMEYIDASATVAITPAIQFGVSFQTLKQTFGDVSQPTPFFGTQATNFPAGLPVVQGTGGVAASARNNRAQVTMAFFF